MAAAHLGFGHFEQGNKKKSKRYLDFVYKNEELLDWDERVIFDRIKGRISPK